MDSMIKARIFIGLEEIASVASTYAKGFSGAGYLTRTLVLRKNPYYPDSQYDVVIDQYQDSSPAGARIPQKLLRLTRRKIVLVIQFFRALTTCDIFLFLFGSSFLPGYLDYPILKLFGKRVVCVFLGSDIRHGYVFRQHMRRLGVEDEIRPFVDLVESYPFSYAKLRRRVRAAERFGDLILSQAGYGQLQTRPYMRVNVPIDLAKFRFNVPDRAVPLVLHVPSNPAVKGSDHVLAAVEQLKKEGIEFEFRLIEKTPNAEVRELLAQSDIVVDELYADTVGVLSLEAMASGNVTLVRYAPELSLVPSDCPAVNVTKDTLVEKLRQVILDRELRRQLAYQGRAFVEAHHDHVRIAQQIVEWLQPGALQQYDFVPDFYKDLVVPSGLAAAERGKIIRFWWHKLTGSRQEPSPKKT